MKTLCKQLIRLPRRALFNLMFSAMLTDACRDERPGLRVACRTDGQLLSQRPMYFQSRVATVPIHELLFPDDSALNATSEGDMQSSMDLLVAPATTSTWSSTVVMHQPPPNAAYNAPQVNVNGVQQHAVDNFTCLGSTLSHSTKINDEVSHRISMVSQAFGRLKNIVCNRHEPNVSTELKMSNAIILPTTLYGAET
ncbi:hypothetical protein SprV_0200640100 [Sparganum proliferum]